LASCSSTGAADPQLSLTGGSLTVEGTQGKSSVLQPDSPGVAKIAELLQNKKGQWEHSSVTYAPVTLVRGAAFTINIQKGRIIVNAPDASGRIVQVVSKLTDDEYNQVTKAVRESAHAY
jgi:hypothetical protein